MLLGGATMTFAFDTPVWSLAFEIVANFAHATLLWRIGRAVLAVIALLSGAALLAAMIHFASPSLGWETRTFVAGFFRIGFSYVVGIMLYRIVWGGAVGEWRVPLIVPIVVLIAVLHGPLPPLWAVERGAVITFLVFPAIVVLIVVLHGPLPPLWAVERPGGDPPAADGKLGGGDDVARAIVLPVRCDPPADRDLRRTADRQPAGGGAAAAVDIVRVRDRRRGAGARAAGRLAA